MEKPKAILAQALKMKPADKFMIIEALLNSLDEPDKDIEEIWAIEAEKRLKAYKEGKLKTLTYEEVFGENDEIMIIEISETKGQIEPPEGL